MKNKKGIIPITIGLLLITAALCLTGYNLWDNKRAEKVSDAAVKVIEQQIKKEVIPPEGKVDNTTGETEYPDYVLNPEMEPPSVEYEYVKYIGVLQLPTLNKILPVVGNYTFDNLKYGPCLYSGSPYKDSFSICAHNYIAHFASIGELQIGDRVVFEDMDGNVFTYSVTEVEVVEPTDIESIVESESELTLFTCTVSGQTRLAVRCNKVKNG